MEAKQFGAVSVSLKALDPDDEAGQFEAILSAPTLDRDGEVIDAKAFEPLPDFITLDVDHGMTTESTVGSGVPFYDGDLLKIRGSFSSLPRAQNVRTLVMEGHVRSMSVAFMNANREMDADDERVHIRRAELLNAAFVAIPSNREAAILSAKSLAACPVCAAKSPATVKPEDAAAPAPASPPPDRSGIKALAVLAEAELALIGASTPPIKEN